MGKRRIRKKSSADHLFDQPSHVGRVSAQQYFSSAKFREAGLSEERTKRLVEDGYQFLEAFLSPRDQRQTPCVLDTFYGTRSYYGLLPLSSFLEYANTGVFRDPTPGRFVPQTLRITSLAQARDLLEATACANPKYRHFWRGGYFCYRGQNTEYLMQRSVPNPTVAKPGGGEPLILPSYWRRFSSDWNSRPGDYKPPPKIIWSSVVYSGLDPQLAEKNFIRYGLHSMSDLFEFPDNESREYYRRYKLFHLSEVDDLPLVQQHYGLDTPFLDVTFDLAVALFFATHRFECDQVKGRCRYEYVGTNKGQALLYVFIFVSPPLTKTADLVRNVPLFSHCPAVRPLRQSCALSYFDGYSINQAVTDLYCRLELAEEFDPTGLPSAETLFPSMREDPFYRAVARDPLFEGRIPIYDWA